MARNTEVEAAMNLLLTKWQIKHVAEITRCGSSKKHAIRTLVNRGIEASKKLPISSGKQT